MKQYLLSVYQPADRTPPPEVLGPIMDKVGKWRDEALTAQLSPASLSCIRRMPRSHRSRSPARRRS
jgi:hypothetical protein